MVAMGSLGMRHKGSKAMERGVEIKTIPITIGRIVVGIIIPSSRNQLMLPSNRNQLIPSSRNLSSKEEVVAVGDGQV